MKRPFAYQKGQNPNPQCPKRKASHTWSSSARDSKLLLSRARCQGSLAWIALDPRPMFPRIRGPNADPKQSASDYQDTHKKDTPPPIYRSSKISAHEGFSLLPMPRTTVRKREVTYIHSYSQTMISQELLRSGIAASPFSEQ